MTDSDSAHDALERLEWEDARRGVDDSPQSRLRQFTRRAALTGGAAGLAAFALDACGGGTKTSGASGGSIFGSSKSYKFTFVNHVTTNTFFTPTQSGAADACKLLGCSYQWTGSQNSNVGEMVSSFNSAVSAGVDGIAVALISTTAFNSPVQKALSAGIPVLSY